VARLALNVANRPPAAALESALRQDYALLDAKRRIAEQRVMQLESVLFQQHRQARVAEWHAKEKRREAQQIDEDVRRDAQAEKEQLRAMLQQALGDEENEEEEKRIRRREAERTYKALASNTVGPEDTEAKEAEGTESTASARARAQREHLFESMAPVLASVQREEAEWKARAAAASAAFQREEEASIRAAHDEAVQRAHKHAELHAMWLKKHPPLPSHVLARQMRRVERRNPHEWLNQHRELDRA